MDTSSVFSPDHYGGKENPYETIKVLEAWLTPDEMIGFCKGNAIKYQTRHRQKGGLTDLSKAAWYQNYLVTYLAARGLTAFGPNTAPPDQQQPAQRSSPALTTGPAAPPAQPDQSPAPIDGSAGAPPADGMESEIGDMIAKLGQAEKTA